MPACDAFVVCCPASLRSLSQACKCERAGSVDDTEAPAWACRPSFKRPLLQTRAERTASDRCQKAGLSPRRDQRVCATSLRSMGRGQLPRDHGGRALPGRKNRAGLWPNHAPPLPPAGARRGRRWFFAGLDRDAETADAARALTELEVRARDVGRRAPLEAVPADRSPTPVVSPAPVGQPQAMRTVGT